MSIYVNTIFKVCFVEYTNGKNTGLNKMTLHPNDEWMQKQYKIARTVGGDISIK